MASLTDRQTQDKSWDKIMKDLDSILGERELKITKNRLKLGDFAQALNVQAR